MLPTTALIFTASNYTPGTELSFAPDSVSGTLVVSETISDTFVADGASVVQGSLLSVEPSADTLLILPLPLVQGDLTPVELNDTFLISGEVLAQGTLILTEGNDLLVIHGVLEKEGDLSSIELSTDSFFAAETANILIGVEFQADTFLSLPIQSEPIENIVSKRLSVVFSGDNLVDVQIPVQRITARLQLQGTTAADLFFTTGKAHQQTLLDFKEGHGTFVITYTDELVDGTENSSKSDTFLISSLSSSRGGRNWSINISGVFNFVQPPEVRSINLTGVSNIRGNMDGSTTIKCDLDRRLLPNDRAIYEGVTYDVQAITQVAQEKSIYMEVFTN